MRGWASLLMVAAVAAAPCHAAAQGARRTALADGCRFEVIGAGKVAAIIDGRSFRLDDGREVRIAGIEVPLPPFPGEIGARAAAGIAARAALAQMLDGQSVELRQRGELADRYGRMLAHVYLAGSARCVARELLAQGQARVAAHVGEAACAAEFLAAERTARTAGVGLWGEPVYAILAAESGAALLAQRGRFSVVEGRLVSVRESGGTIYMNFGRRWSDALTVTVLKRHERSFAAAGVTPKALENRRLRVRGVVEERSGPRIEASRPEQIEIAELN